MDELIKQLIEKHIPITLDIGIVKEVEEDICHVESQTTEKDYFDCRINAIEKNEGDRFKITPKKGSSVVFGIFKDTEKAIIISVSEVEKIEAVIDSTDFLIDEEGYQIVRDDINLKDVLKQGFVNQNKLNQEVQKILVSIGTSPNVPSLNVIKQNTETDVINKILTILK